MQSQLKQIKAADVQVAAISYDSVDTLFEFGKASKIGFPLLSDEDSKTIDAYGLRNDKAKDRADGIPHPGTILVGRDGKIQAKLFYSVTKRHPAKELIEAAAKASREQPEKRQAAAGAN